MQPRYERHSDDECAANLLFQFKRHLHNTLTMKPWLFFCFSCLIFYTNILSAQRNFAADHARLAQEVERRFQAPSGEPKNLEPYLEVLQAKAKDRDEIEQIYNELKASELPSDQKETLLANYELLYSAAQRSGNYTVERAVKNCLEWNGPWKRDTWQNELVLVQRVGRPLLNGTLETGFNADVVMKVTHCSLNFALLDLEMGNVGLYHGRENEFGHVDENGLKVIPDRDFEVRCEARGNFTMSEKGKPQTPADEGLRWADEIRQECLWPGWNFTDLYDNATALMNQYFKDVMCKLPSENGHRWFGNLARNYKGMEKSVEYNEGFYANLKGIAEWESENGREPAGGAEVMLWIPKDNEKLTTTTGPDGKYAIENALLHKTCSPFEAEARQYESSDKKEFQGILEEPNSDAIHRENFVFELWPILSLEKTETYFGNLIGEYRSIGEGPVKLDKKTGKYEVIIKATSSGHLSDGEITSTHQGQSRIIQNGELKISDEGVSFMNPLNGFWSAEYQSWTKAPGFSCHWQATVLFDEKTRRLDYSGEGRDQNGCTWSGKGFQNYMTGEWVDEGIRCCPTWDPPCGKDLIGIPPFHSSVISGLQVEHLLEWKDGSQLVSEYSGPPAGVHVKQVFTLHFRKRSGK